MTGNELYFWKWGLLVALLRCFCPSYWLLMVTLSSGVASLKEQARLKLLLIEL